MIWVLVKTIQKNEGKQLNATVELAVHQDGDKIIPFPYFFSKEEADSYNLKNYGKDSKYRPFPLQYRMTEMPPFIGDDSDHDNYPAFLGRCPSNEN